MIVLTKVVQTCHGCPSQWDAWDKRGQYYYLRYRWGFGTVETWDIDVERSWDNTQLVASFSYGDPLDGIIFLEDFLARVPEVMLSGRIDSWPEPNLYTINPSPEQE